jgi:hypothetical protein
VGKGGAHHLNAPRCQLGCSLHLLLAHALIHIVEVEGENLRCAPAARLPSRTFLRAARWLACWARASIISLGGTHRRADFDRRAERRQWAHGGGRERNGAATGGVLRRLVEPRSPYNLACMLQRWLHCQQRQQRQQRERRERPHVNSQLRMRRRRPRAAMEKKLPVRGACCGAAATRWKL